MSGSNDDEWKLSTEAQDKTKIGTESKRSINENSPNGTLVGIIRTYSSNHQMIVIDNANGRFHINSKGEILVSKVLFS
ncbi:hypothetical protein I4U23_021567 [Adineta vaga]|nr:hypothetical protein I4U23_021567 [Adineta vaga]